MLSLLSQALIDYGWVGLLSVAVIAVVVKLSLMVAQLKLPDLFKKTPPPDLQYHPFFANIQYKIASEIPSLDIFPGKPVRETLCRDLLKIYFNILYDKARHIVAMDMDKWSADRWSQEISYHIRRTTVEFNAACVEEGIPPPLVLKFDRWHSSSSELLYEYITTLGHSNMYVNNAARTNTLLLILNLLAVITIADAERSMRELNGDISGMRYKGKKIEES